MPERYGGVKNMAEKKERDFKGVWIPKEIYLNEELSWSEKILFIEIDSLDNEDGCYSRNDYFANFLGVSESHVSRMISKLKKMGFIRVESFDGRTRTLHSNFKLSKADYAKMSRQNPQECQGRPSENAEQNNTVNNIYSNIGDKDVPTPEKPKPSDKFCGQEFSEPMKEKLTEWLTYKAERKESYKPTGLKSFISEVSNKLKTYAEEDIISLIGECMANNWRGIIWDKLKGNEKPPEPIEKPMPQEILDAKKRKEEGIKNLKAGKGSWRDAL